MVVSSMISEGGNVVVGPSNPLLVGGKANTKAVTTRTNDDDDVDYFEELHRRCIKIQPKILFADYNDSDNYQGYGEEEETQSMIVDHQIEKDKHGDDGTTEEFATTRSTQQNKSFDSSKNLLLIASIASKKLHESTTSSTNGQDNGTVATTRATKGGDDDSNDTTGDEEAVLDINDDDGQAAGESSQFETQPTSIQDNNSGEGQEGENNDDEEDQQGGEDQQANQDNDDQGGDQPNEEEEGNLLGDNDDSTIEDDHDDGDGGGGKTGSSADDTLFTLIYNQVIYLGERIILHQDDGNVSSSSSQGRGAGGAGVGAGGGSSNNNVAAKATKCKSSNNDEEVEEDGGDDDDNTDAGNSIGDIINDPIHSLRKLVGRWSAFEKFNLNLPPKYFVDYGRLHSIKSMAQVSMAVRVAHSLCGDDRCRQRDEAYYQQYDIDVSRILPPIPHNKPLTEYTTDDWKTIQEHVTSIHESLMRNDATVDIFEVMFDATISAGGKEYGGEELLQLVDKHRDETIEPTRETSELHTRRYDKLMMRIELQKALVPIRNALMLDNNEDQDMNEDDINKFWQNYSHYRRNGPDIVWVTLDKLIAEQVNDGQDEDSQQEPLGRKLESMTVVRELMSQPPLNINSFFDNLNETFKLWLYDVFHNRPKLNDVYYPNLVQLDKYGAVPRRTEDHYDGSHIPNSGHRLIYDYDIDPHKDDKDKKKRGHRQRRQHREQTTPKTRNRKPSHVRDERESNRQRRRPMEGKQQAREERQRPPRSSGKSRGNEDSQQKRHHRRGREEEEENLDRRRADRHRARIHSDGNDEDDVPVRNRQRPSGHQEENREIDRSRPAGRHRSERVYDGVDRNRPSGRQSDDGGDAPLDRPRRTIRNTDDREDAAVDRDHRHREAASITGNFQVTVIKLDASKNIMNLAVQRFVSEEQMGVAFGGDGGASSARNEVEKELYSAQDRLLLDSTAASSQGPTKDLGKVNRAKQALVMSVNELIDNNMNDSPIDKRGLYMNIRRLGEKVSRSTNDLVAATLTAAAAVAGTSPSSHVRTVAALDAVRSPPSKRGGNAPSSSMQSPSQQDRHQSKKRSYDSSSSDDEEYNEYLRARRTGRGRNTRGTKDSKKRSYDPSSSEEEIDTARASRNLQDRDTRGKKQRLQSTPSPSSRTKDTAKNKRQYQRDDEPSSSDVSDQDNNRSKKKQAIVPKTSPGHSSAAASSRGDRSPVKKKKRATQKKQYEGRRKWTEEEKSAIKEGVREFGEGKWFKIKEQFSVLLEDRTTTQIKDCYRTMRQRGELNVDDGAESRAEATAESADV